jgi:titin
VYVGFGAAGNTIGGIERGARNVISGNGRHGVLMYGTGNFVQGNFIGTDVTGTAAIGNHFGIKLATGDPSVTTDNTVGGTTPGARNVISGNTRWGVLIEEGASGDFVQGNLIGTDATGTVAVGNEIGVLIDDAGPQNTIGGTIPGARNVISGNLVGVALEHPAKDNLVQGNYIGTDVNGTSAISNGIGVRQRPPRCADRRRSHRELRARRLHWHRCHRH